MFSRVFFLSPTAPVKQISATLSAFCRWRETATLKFYPVDNASESAPFNSKNIQPQPIGVNRGQYPAGYTVQSRLFLFLIPFSLSLSREREEGNTIDYNKSGYFETSPLSRIHLLVTHRFFRGAGGELPPFGSETKKGRGRRKNGYEYKRRTQLRLHQTSFSSRTTRSVWKERKENVYIWRERKRGRESLCLGFHAPAFSTAR